MFNEIKTINADLSMIPMINVIFLLIIFFMVAGQIKANEGLNIEPPESIMSSSAYTDLHPELFITGEGEIYSEGKLLALERLAEFIKPTSNQNSLVIKADKTLPAQQWLLIMNVLKQSDYRLIELILI